MKDWVLSHTQLTPAHSTQVQFTHLCPSPEHRHSLAFEVYEVSCRPTDLTSHLNVSLECVCVLSRISVMRDEVIGYKSPVLEDNSLAGGQVRELGLSVSQTVFPFQVCVHTNRWGKNI